MFHDSNFIELQENDIVSFISIASNIEIVGTIVRFTDAGKVVVSSKNGLSEALKNPQDLTRRG